MQFNVMGNAPSVEQEFSELEKGIVITARCEETSVPSSPSMALDGSQRRHISGSSQQKENIEDVVLTEVPRPPDGGYGWVIVLVSFVCNLVVDGIAYSFGIILQRLAEDFDETVGKVAWAGSLLNGVYLLTGPVASALTNAYGFRPVCIIGSILGSASFALSTVVPNVYTLLFVYGVMGGIGIGLIYLPAIVAVNYYFESRRALATGIAVCGSGVGAFLFAPLASLILATYDWKGVNLIFSAILLLCVFCGALMKPLVFKSPEASQKPLLQLMAEERMKEMQRSSITSESFFIVKLPDGSVEKRPKYRINADPGVHSSLALNEYGLSMSGLPTITEATRATDPSGSDERDMHPEPVRNKSSGSIILSTVAKRTISSPSATCVSKTSRNPSTRTDEDSEKSSDSEKNDVVPELPSGEDFDFNRRGSKKLNRRGSAPTNGPADPRDKSIVKNTSTPLFDGSRRSSSSSYTSRTGTSTNHLGHNLTGNNPRLSVPNPTSIGGMYVDGMLYSVSSVSGTPRGSKGSIPQAGDMLRPLSRQDIFYTGSVSHLAQCHSQRSLASYRASVLSVRRNSSLQTPIEKSGCLSYFGDCSVLRDMLDTSLLRNPVFLLICLSNILGMLGFYIPFVYLIDSAIAEGVSPESAAFLLSVIGITNTLGRIICGYVTDMPRVDALFVSNTCLLLSGVSTMVFPLCSTYTSFVLVALLFGLFVAGYVALTSVMLVDLVGIEKLSNSFGLLILFRGASSIIGSPIAGLLFDLTGKYDASFYTAGALLILSSAFGYAVPPIQKLLDRRGSVTPPQGPTVNSPTVFTTLSPSTDFVEEEESETE